MDSDKARTIILGRWGRRIRTLSTICLGFLVLYLCIYAEGRCTFIHNNTEGYTFMFKGFNRFTSFVNVSNVYNKSRLSVGSTYICKHIEEGCIELVTSNGSVFETIPPPTGNIFILACIIISLVYLPFEVIHSVREDYKLMKKRI